MAQMRRDGVPVTAVAYTTAIKGCVHALDMRAAWAHLEQLLAEAPPLTIRTVNTMLRGCLYVGDLEGTERLVQLAASHGLEPDQATRETVIRATCHGEEHDARAVGVVLAAVRAHPPVGETVLPTLRSRVVTGTLWNPCGDNSPRDWGHGCIN